MHCPMQRRENSDLLLAYVERKLDSEMASTFERHTENCPACQQALAAQMMVWEALDRWDAGEISPDFNRRLYQRIEADERRPSRQVAALLAEQLAVPPQERETFVRVARGELAVARLPPPGPVAARPRTLPPPPTELVGRAHELDELAAILTIGWSYGLLAPAEQQLLRRLSV